MATPKGPMEVHKLPPGSTGYEEWGKSLFIVATSAKRLRLYVSISLNNSTRKDTKISLKYMFKDFSLLEIAWEGRVGRK